MARRAKDDETLRAQAVVGANIRARRSALGVAQERFAFEAGIDRSFMGRLERGESNATVGTLILLAKALGCTVGDLVEGLPEKDPSTPSCD